MLLVTPACAQEGSAAPAAATAAQNQPAATTVTEPQPEPYSPEEFAVWLRDLRRGEIVAVGAFPLVYIFTQLGYNIFRYGVNGWDPQYAPLGNPNQVPYTESETIGVLLGAASLSILVATADYLIGRARARRAESASGGKP